MNNSIDKVAQLLMYKGPKISDLIAKAVTEEKQFSFDNNNGQTVLTVNSNLAYNTNVQDIYYYNAEDELIKQVLVINNKQNIVFDKYKDARELIGSIKTTETRAS